MKKIEHEIGDTVVYVSRKGMSELYNVHQDQVSSIEITNKGVYYKVGTSTVSKTFDDLVKAKEHAISRNKEQLERIIEGINKKELINGKLCQK